MPLSAEAIERVARLEYSTEADLRHWVWLWDNENESVFWCYLRKSEEAAEEYRRWFPRLQAFASECRQAVPVPTVQSFTTTEREQYRVLVAKMRKFAESGDLHCVLSRKPFHAAILWTTKVGLTAAQEVFAGSEAVILEESEKERWFSEFYQVDLGAFWWYALAWWTLKVGLPGEDEAMIRESYPIPKECSYWVVESGVQWGSLAGGANHELWRWNGRRAKYIETYCHTSY